MSTKMTSEQLEALKEDALRYVIPHFAENEELEKGPKIFMRGEGCYLFDVEGKRYLDTFASLLTTICGHCRPEVDAAIREQIERLEFFPNYVDTFTVPLIELARKIAEIMPGDLSVSFFVNSGSEANETAIKMARQYHRERGEMERYKVIFRRQSYHGTTLGGCSATGIGWFREYFDPMLIRAFVPTFSAQCSNCEIGLEPGGCNLRCLDLVEEQIRWEGPNTVAAMIMDPLPGSNTGFPVPREGYIQRVRDICDRYGILLIFDEVQSGFGKTGKMFVCEHWGVTPDIMSIGKGFTGGYVPLAAAVTTEKIAKVFREPGSEFRSGSTYGGHTLACAATLANIAIIEREDLPARAERMGRYLVQRLETLRAVHPMIGRISGMGLLQALFLVRSDDPDTLIEDSVNVGGFIREFCYSQGMILRNNHNILVFAPALIITEGQIDEIMAALDRALAAARSEFDL